MVCIQYVYTKQSTNVCLFGRVGGMWLIIVDCMILEIRMCVCVNRWPLEMHQIRQEVFVFREVSHHWRETATRLNLMHLSPWGLILVSNKVSAGRSPGVSKGISPRPPPTTINIDSFFFFFFNHCHHILLGDRETTNEWYPKLFSQNLLQRCCINSKLEIKRILVYNVKHEVRKPGCWLSE